MRRVTSNLTKCQSHTTCAKTVTGNKGEEETLRQRIRQLKEKEQKIREERHRLESQLREKIFKKFKEIEEKIAE